MPEITAIRAAAILNRLREQYGVPALPSDDLLGTLMQIEPGRAIVKRDGIVYTISDSERAPVVSARIDHGRSWPAMLLTGAPSPDQRAAAWSPEEIARFKAGDALIRSIGEPERVYPYMRPYGEIPFFSGRARPFLFVAHPHDAAERCRRTAFRVTIVADADGKLIDTMENLSLVLRDIPEVL